MHQDKHARTYADWRRLSRAGWSERRTTRNERRTCTWRHRLRIRRKHACGAQNSRGLWLRHWAAQHQLVQANTFFFFFKKQDHSKATYRETKKHCKQLDHVLINRALFKHLEEKQKQRTDGHAWRSQGGDSQNQAATRPHNSIDKTLNEK